MMRDPLLIQTQYQLYPQYKPRINLRASIHAGMDYVAGSLDATLAAAAGDDAALFAELRGAFIESLAMQIDLLRRARCDGNWIVAAMRLKGLAVSFHSDVLIRLAEEALDCAPGEPTVIRDLHSYLEDLRSP